MRRHYLKVENVKCKNCKILQERCDKYRKVLEFIAEEKYARNDDQIMDNYIDVMVEAKVTLEEIRND